MTGLGLEALALPDRLPVCIELVAVTLLSTAVTAKESLSTTDEPHDKMLNWHSDSDPSPGFTGRKAALVVGLDANLPSIGTSVPGVLAQGQPINAQRRGGP